MAKRWTKADKFMTSYDGSKLVKINPAHWTKPIYPEFERPWNKKVWISSGHFSAKILKVLCICRYKCPFMEVMYTLMHDFCQSVRTGAIIYRQGRRNWIFQAWPALNFSPITQKSRKVIVVLLILMVAGGILAKSYLFLRPHFPFVRHPTLAVHKFWRVQYLYKWSERGSILFPGMLQTKARRPLALRMPAALVFSYRVSNLLLISWKSILGYFGIIRGILVERSHIFVKRAIPFSDISSRLVARKAKMSASLWFTLQNLSTFCHLSLFPMTSHHFCAVSCAYFVLLLNPQFLYPSYFLCDEPSEDNLIKLSLWPPLIKFVILSTF